MDVSVCWRNVIVTFGGVSPMDLLMGRVKGDGRGLTDPVVCPEIWEAVEEHHVPCSEVLN